MTYLKGASEDLSTAGKTLQHSFLEILEFCWEEESLTNIAKILMKTKYKIKNGKINGRRISFCTLGRRYGGSFRDKFSHKGPENHTIGFHPVFLHCVELYYL